MRSRTRWLTRLLGPGSWTNARRLLYRRRGIFGFSQQREVHAAVPQAAQAIHERSGYERRGIEVLTRQRAATKDVDPEAGGKHKIVIDIQFERLRLAGLQVQARHAIEERAIRRLMFASQ